MSIAVGDFSAVSSPYAPGRPINFGSLARVNASGSNEAASNPFDGLIDLAPKNVNLNRRGALDRAEEVAEADKVVAAKQAIKELQQARMAHEDDSAEKLAAQKACLACKTVDIMV